MALQKHDKWIVGFGLVDRAELIRRRLLTTNTTSGDIVSMVVPTHQVVDFTPTGERMRTERLFPGYFFLGVSDESPNWREMGNIDDVFSILTVDGSPAFLTPQDIQNITALIEEPPHEAAARDFAPGDAVTVTDGSFRGLCGRIVEIRRFRAKVEIEIRNRTIPAMFPLHALRPRRRHHAHQRAESS